jgi:plasmid stability protein
LSQTTERRVVIQTWAPLALADELRSRASRAERSLSAEIRFALLQYLNDERRPHQAGAVKDRADGRDNGKF